MNCPVLLSSIGVLVHTESTDSSWSVPGARFRHPHVKKKLCTRSCVPLLFHVQGSASKMPCRMIQCHCLLPFGRQTTITTHKTNTRCYANALAHSAAVGTSTPVLLLPGLPQKKTFVRRSLVFLKKACARRTPRNRNQPGGECKTEWEPINSVPGSTTSRTRINPSNNKTKGSQLFKYTAVDYCTRMLAFEAVHAQVQLFHRLQPA